MIRQVNYLVVFLIIYIEDHDLIAILTMRTRIKVLQFLLVLPFPLLFIKMLFHGSMLLSRKRNKRPVPNNRLLSNKRSPLGYRK